MTGYNGLKSQAFSAAVHTIQETFIRVFFRPGSGDRLKFFLQGLVEKFRAEAGRYGMSGLSSCYSHRGIRISFVIKPKTVNALISETHKLSRTENLWMFLNFLRQHEPELKKRFGIATIGIFGSFITGRGAGRK